MKSTKEILLDAAATTLAQNPGASMNEIARSAGVGRATLYRYFPSREAILRELTIEASERSEQAIAPILAQAQSAIEILRNCIDALVPLGDRYHFLLSAPMFEDDPEITKLYEQQSQAWIVLVEALKRDDVIASDIPTAWVVAAIEGLIYTAWSSVHDGYIARRDAPDLVFRTLLKGLSANLENRQL